MTGLLSILFYLLLLLAFIVPALQRRLMVLQRLRFMNGIERKRGARLITMIHRQESLSFLGIPIARYIDIEDSEAVLRAIHLTDPELPIDLVLHTPGGLVLAAEQIAHALKNHPAKVTVFVPHYAMSGGTLIALAADEIAMDSNAVLGPVDPQIGDMQRGSFPAVSVLAALATPNPNRDDAYLIMGDIAKKAVNQVRSHVYDFVKDRMGEKASRLADILTEGRWTHDYPISAAEALEMGLSVRTDMPREFYALMDLFPQPGHRAGVEYVPVPYRRK
ncbi:MAG: ATP-dependent Clp protease proteolytic subunit [Actinobacteria bacterium]|nr:ATP-dependent Clp protease proteolytic subunit [Actinomycetota bacterium]